MEIEKEFHRLDQAASWAAIYQKNSDGQHCMQLASQPL